MSGSEMLDRVVGLVDRLVDERLSGGAGDGGSDDPPRPVDPVAQRDAIDAVLGGAPRTTRVTPLRESAEMQRFRRELSDGLIRIDTINQALRLLALVLERVMRP